REVSKGKGVGELKQIVEYLRRRAKTDRRKKYQSTVEKVKSAIEKASNRLLIKPIEYLRKRSKGQAISPACFFRDSIIDGGASSFLA
ncbi:MAG TPA: hypothetical protein VKA70_10045, partial [Blastocatellia bacterium]|nr:hypothetical protein [Blastocatellia bacterium]